jgi:hypothetical protein
VQNKAVLQWNAFTEKANHRFIIEHSKDGRYFTAIGQLNGIAGSWQTYRFVDPSPVFGKNYYRIKMIPEAGTEKISGTVILTEKWQEEFILTSLVNPFVEELRFDLQAPRKEIVTIQLIDALGKLVYVKSETVTTGINRMQLNNLPDMHSGIYILRLHTGSGVINKKIKKE